VGVSSDEKLKRAARPARGYEELDEEHTEPSITIEDHNQTPRQQTSPDVSPRDEGEHTNPYKLTWRDFNQNFHSTVPSLNDEQKKACLKNQDMVTDLKPFMIETPFTVKSSVKF
jgi:flagellar hook-basal body complex protein FliE